MTCSSSLPAVRPAGWTCTGADLVQITTLIRDGVTLPVVVPRDRVNELPLPGPGEPYDNSGDHIHMALDPAVDDAHLRAIVLAAVSAEMSRTATLGVAVTAEEHEARTANAVVSAIRQAGICVFRS